MFWKRLFLLQAVKSAAPMKEKAGSSSIYSTKPEALEEKKATSLPYRCGAYAQQTRGVSLFPRSAPDRCHSCFRGNRVCRLFCPRSPLFCKGNRCPRQRSQEENRQRRGCAGVYRTTLQDSKAARAAEFSPSMIQRFRIDKAKPFPTSSTPGWKSVKRNATQRFFGTGDKLHPIALVQTIRYLENGHITPDNNSADNAISPFAVGRETGCSPAARTGPMPPPRFTA